jgi:hypothetical protein
VSIYVFDCSQKWIAKILMYRPIYTAVFRLDEVVFLASKNPPAETIGRLNQKFFGRRVETMFSSPLPPSRVFSKNL